MKHLVINTTLVIYLVLTCICILNAVMSLDTVQPNVYKIVLAKGGK